ncbi:DsbA family protein, partial [Candidatus Woesearchaeota archaeon]|nr:DsbA family protein [Candidatus Woesearchaeota archaeon]
MTNESKEKDFNAESKENSEQKKENEHQEKTETKNSEEHNKHEDKHEKTREHNTKKNHHEEHKHNSHKHKKHEDSTINISTTSFYKGISVVLGILLIISIFTSGFGIITAKTVAGTQEKTNNPGIKTGPAETGTLTGNVPNVKFENANIKGEENAPVTIVEWSDFECPFCARFYSQTYNQIIKEYVDTGRANFVFKHFPLGFHAQAQKAAEASECAGEQGMFWEMHDVLFEKGVAGGVAGF